MTSTADIPGIQMSLDADFTPPTREQWIEKALVGLGSAESDSQALQKLRRTALEGIPLDVLYDSADVTFQSYPPSNRPQNLDNRLSVRLGDSTTRDAATANTSILQGLAGGITSIELHTIDADNIASALHGTQLDLAKISLRSANGYQACASELATLADSQGIDPKTLHCELNADPLGQYLKGETSQESLNSDIARMADFAKASAHGMPLARSILVDATIHHNAGASTVEELHAALATAVVYLEALLDAGLSADDASQTISFQIGMDADVLLGVAKLRALSALWPQLVHLIDSRASLVQPAFIIAETSRRNHSKLQPWNNHLRHLAAGTAAILGGAEALIVHPHDVLLRESDDIDTALGDRMARNVAIILERECGLRKVHDPMAGSYAIENLTQQLLRNVWQSLSSTDTSEGWLDELTSGRWHTRLATTHQQRVSLLESEQRIAIGVNRFVHAESVTQSLTTSSSNTSSSSMNSALLKPVRDAEVFEQQALAEAIS